MKKGKVLEILKRIPAETKKKLGTKGYFPQDGYILRKLRVPPNCLSVPDISDGTTIISSDVSVSILGKVLKQAEIIKSSRSGAPNFESHEVEANELQSAIALYLHVRVAQSVCCCFLPPDAERSQVPCLQFSWQDTSACTSEQTSQLMANSICSILLETIVKGDPQVIMLALYGLIQIQQLG
ncbi:hypothetical protein MKW94_026171 [Papaver nudicaule]|uniref:DNA-directed RNA polymerase n=1 Tax=Papaver nudicaule TaxID=74823 RepID=A0AA41UUM0_PAPNU|nr:hypothetical protein [Papaver nudicaule]